jgi:hypothetical protein
MRCVTFFGRRTQASYWAGCVDCAEFFCPKIIFRHIAKPSERAQATRRADAPAGFLKNLAMQRWDRMFAGIDPTSGKLEFRLWVLLMGQ